MQLNIDFRVSFSTVQKELDASAHTASSESISASKDPKIRKQKLTSILQLGCTAATVAIASIICIPGLSNWADSLVANFDRQEQQQQFTKRINGMLFTGEPNVDGAIAAIRFGEGTLHANGHRQLVYGGLANDLSAHPFENEPSKYAFIKGRKVYSTAAGIGQFLETTWKENAEPLGISDFSENSQLNVMIRLLEDSGAMAFIEQGKFDEALPFLCPIWASLPCYKGDTRGAYNQNVKPWSKLLAIYQEYGSK